MPALRNPVLPDLLPKGLALVFCGTAPGNVSAAAGHYYAHPQNKFWRTLYATRLTPRLLAPSEYAALPEFGIGLTDIVKYAAGQDNQLPRGSLGSKAVQDLRTRIEKCAPRILAFTSLTGGRSFLGAKAGFGAQKEKIGPTRIWILPSPSPKAHWNWDEKVWRELAGEVRSIKNAA
jgi:TDG/mug DNA glycosylase family protein